MYQKYKLIKTSQVNYLDYKFTIIIHDDDFEETIEVISTNIVPASFVALIKIYSSKELNVIANIYKLFVHFQTIKWDKERLINFLCKEIPEFNLYSKDLNKYFMLS